MTIAKRSEYQRALDQLIADDWQYKLAWQRRQQLEAAAAGEAELQDAVTQEAEALRTLTRSKAALDTERTKLNAIAARN